MAENERRRTEETGIAGKSLSVVEEEGGWKRSVLVACMSQEGPRLRRDKMLVVGAGDAGATRGGLRLSWKCSGSDGPGLGPGFESVRGSPLARAGRLCGAVSVRRKGGEFCSRPLCAAAVAAAAAVVVPEPDREGGRHDGNVGDAVAAHNDGNLFHRASVDSAADAGGGRGDSDGGCCGGGASRGADKVAVAAGSDSAVEGNGRPVVAAAAVAGSAAETREALQVDCTADGCGEGGGGDREGKEPSPPRSSSLRALKNTRNKKSSISNDLIGYAEYF